MDAFTNMRTNLVLLTCLLTVACANMETPVKKAKKEPEILYIYSDGTMEFKGRVMNKKDVIVYEDGRGGERAAVKLMIPLHPDVFRDTITVERKDLDVPVARR